VAIDLGSRVTKAVYIQQKGEGQELLSYSMQDTPPPEKGSISSKMPEHLKKVMQDLGAKTKQVAMTLGVSDSILRHADLPMIPVPDMRQMLKFNSKNYLQQDLPDHVFDCHLLAAGAAAGGEAPKAGGKCKVLIGAAKRQVVADLENAGKTAGLSVEMIVPGLAGPPNAFERAQPEVFAKEIVALADVGYKNTTISVLQGGELMLTRVVGVGGEKLTGGLAESLGISYAEAEGMKLGMPEDVQMVMTTLLIPLGRELRASVDFFEHQYDKAVGQVFISGGSARSEFIVKTLKEELMLETKTWNPVGFMQLGLSPQKMGEIEQVAPQLAVVTGVALSAF
jgi:type IV pilus assembly protein PilM